MSNRYRLVKEYPGSPKLESIVELKDNGGYELKNSTSYFMTKDKVENYPEFWKEVVEKDYKILSLARFCSIKPTITDVSDYGDELIEALLKCDKSRIHSVKRLSDGEIFTVNDDVVSKTCAIPNKILSIELINNKIRLYPRNSYYNLKDVCKAKQKLFTTEDGVDIFEGDNLYSIDNMLNIRKHLLFNARYDDNTLLNNRIFFNSDYKHFSTKEKAEEYILMNEPVLSFNDISNLFPGYIHSSSNFIPKLKDLIKTKLKND